MTSYSGTFQYTQPTTDYNDSDSPFVNTDGSFTTLTKSTSISGSNTIVSGAYVFDDSGNSSVDGLYLNGTITTPGNMTIDDFNSIPMSRQGSQFKNYTGSFPSTSTNIPTLLPNSSLSRMFEGAINYNQDVSTFDVSTITNFNSAFKGATNFNQNLGSWYINSATDMSNMLDNTGLSITNYSDTLIGWSTVSPNGFYRIFDPDVNLRYVSHYYDIVANGIYVYGTTYSSLNKDPNNNYSWATFRASNTVFIDNGLPTFNAATDIPFNLTDRGRVITTIPAIDDDTGVFIQLNFDDTLVSGIVISRRESSTQIISSYRVKTFDGTTWNLVTPQVEYVSGTNRFEGSTISDLEISNKVSKFIGSIRTTAVRIYPTSGDSYLSAHFGIEADYTDVIPSNITLGASTLTYNADGEIAKNSLISNNGWTINDSGFACVHESTDFLCYIDNEEIYINIKDIKPGFLVKTYKEGYVKVKHIFKQKCFNSKKNTMKKFFVMDKNKNDLLTKDLIITGGHSVLLDNLTEEQYNKMKSSKTKYIKVHDKYKLLAFFNEDFVGKKDKTEETVYLLVLEADDDFKVYGVYVNGGMIIESCGMAICKQFGLL